MHVTLSKISKGKYKELIMSIAEGMLQSVKKKQINELNVVNIEIQQFKLHFKNKGKY